MWGFIPLHPAQMLPQHVAALLLPPSGCILAAGVAEFGRRKGLKTLWALSRAGSSPAARTILGSIIVPKAGDKEAIHCPYCEKAVMAQIVGQVDRNKDLPDFMERVTLLICNECEQITLINQTGELEPGVDALGNQDWLDRWDEPVVLYPARNKRFDSSVPDTVSRTYYEAIKCLNAGTYTAATIMERRSLEIVCQELGEKSGKKNLFQKIESLAKKGSFSGKVSDWADLLRNVGNFAAHDPNATFSKQQAILFVDFVEALIEHCFVLESKFQLLEKHVNALKKKPSE